MKNIFMNSVRLWRPFCFSVKVKVAKSSFYRMISLGGQVEKVFSQNRSVFDIEKQWISSIFDDFWLFNTILMDSVGGVPKTLCDNIMACKNGQRISFQGKKPYDNTTPGRYRMMCWCWVGSLLPRMSKCAGWENTLLYLPLICYQHPLS